MEPTLIFAASDELKYQVKWVRETPDSEWIYIGSGKEVNEFSVMKKVQEVFTSFKCAIEFSNIGAMRYGTI